MSVEGGSDGSSESDSVAALHNQFREEAQSVTRDQVDKAVQQLARDREVTDAEQAELERLGTRLTEAILGEAESRLDASEPESARVVANVFQIE